MTLPLNALVTILANTTHPHLAGRRGVVVHITPEQKECGCGGRRSRLMRCGQNPILQVEGVGRVLLPREAVVVVDEAAA